METIGTVSALWRYPVKSLRGEPLQRVRVGTDGLPGDRAAALIVESPLHARAGKPFRGKESSRLHLTADPETAASYAADAGTLVTLDRSRPHFFDAGTVSLVLDTWVRDVEALVGATLDPLRWRPNLFVTAADGFTLRERELVGTRLHAGELVLDVVAPIRRCVTPTYDVQTGEAMPDVLETVAASRENIVGVYCEVIAAGDLGIGDTLAAAPAAAVLRPG